MTTSDLTRPRTLLKAKAVIVGDNHDFIVLPPGHDPVPIVAGRRYFEFPMQDGYVLLAINDGPSQGCIETMAEYGIRYDAALEKFVRDREGAIR